MTRAETVGALLLLLLFLLYVTFVAVSTLRARAMVRHGDGVGLAPAKRWFGRMRSGVSGFVVASAVVGIGVYWQEPAFMPNGLVGFALFAAVAVLVRLVPVPESAVDLYARIMLGAPVVSSNDEEHSGDSTEPSDLRAD